MAEGVQGMTTLLFAMVDAVLELRARAAESDCLYLTSDRWAPMGTHTLGWWRSCWPVGEA